MKRITIKKNGVITNQAELSVVEAAEWLANHKKMKTFGEDDIFEKQPILITPAVYETRQVLIKAEVTEQREILDANGESFNPQQFETVVIEPAVYEAQQFLTQEEVYQTEQILIEPAITEEHEVLDANGASFNPPQFETVTITPAVYETRQVLQDVLVRPSDYEIIEEDITLELQLELDKQIKIAKGKVARQVCENVLDLVSGYNLDRQLTLEQITQMQQTFANAESALRAGRPTFAKSFISAIQADEVLVTQEMKDLCLSLLREY